MKIFSIALTLFLFFLTTTINGYSADYCSGENGADWILCEDFEPSETLIFTSVSGTEYVYKDGNFICRYYSADQPTLECAFPRTQNSSMQDAFAANCGHPINNRLSSAQSNSGGYSLKLEKPTTSNSGGDVEFDFAEQDEVYVRWYWYFPPGFSSGTLDGISIGSHLFFMNTAYHQWLGIDANGNYVKSNDLPTLSTGSWTDTGSNVWSASCDPSVHHVASVRFDGVWGVLKNSAAEVVAANEWYHADNVLYVYSTSNPDTAYTNPGLWVADNARRSFNMNSTLGDIGRATISVAGFESAREPQCWDCANYVGAGQYTSGDATKPLYYKDEDIDNTYWNLSENEGRWICFEFYANNNNYTTKLWIDGELWVDSNPDQLSWETTGWTGFNKIIFSNYRHDAAFPNTLYVDDVVVSTSYIGPRDDGIAVTIDASRLSGVAPLSVHFYDSEIAASTTSSKPFHDREYTWDFGDFSAGTWGTNDKSKNAAKGAVSAHVYETPGNYTVTLTVRDETGIIGSDTEIITVTDPDTVYAGTLTTCVCDVANNDFTGCPSGANQVCTNDLSTTTGYAGVGERLLFHRGSSWTSGSLSFPNNFGPVSIGAYGTGTGADDLGIYSNAPHITMTGTFCSMTDKHNWRICDLYLSAADTVGNGISGEMDMQQILMMRLKTVGFSVPVTFTHWKGSASDLIDQVAIVSNDFYSGRDYCMYMGAERLAVMGNIFHDAGTSHVLRVWQGYRGVVSHNQLSGSSVDNDAGRQALKLHSPLEHLVDPNGVDLCLNNRSTFVIVSDNVFGSSGPWPVSIGPQNGESDERISDLIFERNYLSGDYGTYNGRPISISLSICGRYFSVRNNIIDGIDGANTYTGITILQRGAEPAPIGVEVYNNTIYKSNSGTYAHIGVEVGLNCTDTIVRNNLASFPNATSTRLVLDDDSADGISSNNLLTDTPGFIDPGNATPLLRDFGLLETSLAVNQGTTVNLLDDYTGGYRDYGVYDIGAFEYAGAAPPPPASRGRNIFHGIFNRVFGGF